jgi:hypothetical protein
MNPVAYIYERQNGSAKLVWVREPHDKDIIKEVPLYTAPRELSDDEIDTCAYETGMWCDGTPDAWDTEAIHNFARAILKKASEK